MVVFLLKHKCEQAPSSEDDRHEWIARLEKGDKADIYPVLQWVLLNYDKISKRTYLANFLVPIDVPSEYADNNSELADLMDAFQELQTEFVDVHQQYETMSAKSDRPVTAVLDDIKKLQIEKQQLTDRLQREKDQTSSNPKFQRLLEEASNMRQAQNDEIRLTEQKQKQLLCMKAANQRLRQVQHLSDILGGAKDDNRSFDNMLVELENESQKAIEHLDTSIAAQRHRLELEVLSAKRECNSPLKTEEEIEEIEELGMQLEDDLYHRHEELKRLNRYDDNLSKLSTFQQHVTVIKSKLQAKKEALDCKAIEKEQLISANNKLHKSIAELEDQTQEVKRPGGSAMTKREFEQFQHDLAENTTLCDEAKQDIITMQNDIEYLTKEEATLKNQHYNLEEFLRQREEVAGVADFADVLGHLEATGKQTAVLNDLKAQTLEEISNMVQKIAFTLEEKKKDLEPKVQELKNARTNFQEFQTSYNKNKANHETQFIEIMNDITALERECSRLQEKWHERERSYHFLCAKDEILASNTQCLELEEAWRNGHDHDTHLLPGACSLKDLYENKIQEQQRLVSGLRKHHLDLKARQEYNAQQKATFTSLLKLLELNAKSSNDENVQ
eukprot:scaffold529_cov196-Alexandrium_tamarense.AAC.59